MQDIKTGIEKFDQYVEGVSSGRIVVCRFVKLAITRHIRDLNRFDDDTFEYYFNPDAALHALNYFNNLRHWKGKWAGQIVVLEPWQVFIVGSLFGWLRKDNNLRRFREAYNEVGRKNGKTTMLAGIGLYMMDFDNEPGAEIYSAATSRSQSMIVFNDAYQMVSQSDKLRRELTLRKSTIVSNRMKSKFMPLSKESKRMDGFNTHCGIFDELHAWPSRDLYDVIDTSTGSRQQPLLISITTAGDNREGICYETRDYLIKVLEGIIEDERFFGIIFTIDKGDEDRWDQPDVWRKANPNFGISLFEEDLLALVNKARESEAKKNDFKTKRLNIWISSYSSWMNMDSWYKNENDQLDIEKFKGKPCYITLDLSSKLDLASYALLFRDSKKLVAFTRNYLPELTIERNLIGKKSVYKAWQTAGWIRTCAGEVIDYDQILEDITTDISTYDVQAVGFDPFQAITLVQGLQKRKVKTIEFGQTVKNLSEPSKELEALVVSSGIEFQKDPVLRWAVSNVVVKYDRKDNIFPTKDGKDNKIDPAIALIMGIGLHLIKPIKPTLKRRARVYVA
jgi:phage terminase large subunit-like protein